MIETANAIVELTLSREALSAGGKFEVAFDRRFPCEKCKGSGRKEGTPPCETCAGKGVVEKILEGSDPPLTITPACATCDGFRHARENACDACDRGATKTEAKVMVEVPSHSRAGEQFRVKGEGHMTADGTQGDVIVVLGADATKGGPTKSNPATMAVFVLFAIAVLVMALLSAR